MNNTESVGDECAVVTDQLDESLGELDPLGFVLAGLARVETDVLEHQDVTVGESFGTSQRVLSHDVTGELHVATEDFGQLRGNRCEGELGIGLTVGAPEVRGHDDLRSTSASARRVGADATMRPGSVISPPSNGTLRSERTSTVRPSTQRPADPSASELPLLSKLRSERLGDEADEVGEAVGVAPLVVVPGDDLDLVVDDLRQTRVEDRRVRVGDDVRGDDRCVGVLQDALRGPSAAASSRR